MSALPVLLAKSFTKLPRVSFLDRLLRPVTRGIRVQRSVTARIRRHNDVAGFHMRRLFELMKMTGAKPTGEWDAKED